MNWGVKIFITLLIFIIVAVGTGVYMVSQDHDTLVEDNYYEKGLTFNSEYDRKANVEKLDAQPEITIANHNLKISFHQSGNKGTIDFQRTSDSSLDKQIHFSTDSKTYSLPLEDLSTGKWKILITWEHDSIPFLFEKNIDIP